MPLSLLIGVDRVTWCLSLLPLAAWAFVALRDRRQPYVESLAISTAFALSFFMGLFSMLLLNARQPNMGPTYVGAPIQFAAFLILVLPAWQRRFLLVVAGLVVLQWILPADPRAPAVLLMAVAGIAVTVLAWRSRWLGELRPVLIIYCGLAVPFLMVMGPNPPTLEGPYPYAWLGYQLMRTVALTTLTVALVRRPPEVADAVATDTGTGAGDGESRVSVRRRVTRRAVDRGAGLGAQTTTYGRTA